MFYIIRYLLKTLLLYNILKNFIPMKISRVLFWITLDYKNGHKLFITSFSLLFNFNKNRIRLSLEHKIKHNYIIWNNVIVNYNHYSI